MHLVINKGDIIDGLRKASDMMPTRAGAAYLRTAWLKAESGQLNIMATDSNIELMGSYKAEVKEEGLAGVNGRAIYELFRRLPDGPIAISDDSESGNILITQGKKKYKLPVSDVAWFQTPAVFPEDHSVFWSGEFIQELIDRVYFCISDDDGKEAISCMCLKPVPSSQHIEVCGLNIHQFAMVKFMNDDLQSLLGESGILIQRKYLLELKNWITSDEVEIAISNKRLFFRTSDKTEIFSLPLSYYQYPDYEAFLAKVRTQDILTVVAEKSDLISALERIMIFNSESNRWTNFDFSERELTLSAQGQEVGSAVETIDILISGASERIAFPTKNLIEILGKFRSNKIKMLISGQEGPCGITGDEDDNYLVIIMPMKIAKQTYYTEEEA